MATSILDQDFPDEEEDDFNPAPADDSDAENDEKPEADDDDDAPQRSRTQSRSRPGDDDDAKDTAVNKDDEDDEEQGDGDDDEEDEEEEDEDDEDDDIEGQPSRKRRRRHRRNQFIDVEAEVDEEDEEEPEEDEDLPADEMHPDDLQELPPGADRDDRKHRELDLQREKQWHIDVEEEAARLKERYGRQNRASGAGGGIIPQRLLLPSATDPRIWRVKCRPGKEREIIASVYKRILERAASRQPIEILSIFERGGTNSPMAGNLYVEANRMDDITTALQDIEHYFSSIKPSMIALEEMPDLLKVQKTKQLEPSMYVRVKRGLYAGDLAQVDEVESNGTDVVVRLVPRLDYGLGEDSNAPEDANGQKRKRAAFSKQRPPQRLFSESEAKKRHSRYLQQMSGLSTKHWQYQGKEYMDGYLIESFRINNLQTENVNPNLEEVTRFVSNTEDGTENLDLNALAATIKASAPSEFIPGDKVEIFRGEQKGVTGKSLQVYGEVVKVKVDPGNGGLSGQTIEAPIKDLRKLFRDGDHVKVIGGSKYIDEVGMVVKTKDDRVTILTDSNQEEITVFSKDLKEATDSGGATTNSKYALLDLVQLDAATVGCVIKVDRESLRVLDQTGAVRSLLPSNISNRIERRQNAVATDRDGNEIKVEDTIKEFSGEQRSGRVLHLHRNFVFAQNREILENVGVWVARNANVVTVAAKGGRNTTGVDLSKMNPVFKQNGAVPAMMAPPQQKGRDRLIGKSVKVRMGPYKGLVGICKDASGDTAKIELHARNKQVSIKKDILVIIDKNTGKPLEGAMAALGMGRTPAPVPGRTPGYAGGQTPAGFGGAASGGRTPAYAMGGGGRTPAWKQDAGARTPAYATGGGGGGQTAYGGYGGATAYGGGGGGATSYGGGSVWGGGAGGGGVSLVQLNCWNGS